MNFRSILIFITIIGMESSCLYAVLAATNKATAGRLSIPLLLTLLLFSWAVSRSLRCLHWPKPVLTLISWLVWPIFLLLSIKFQLFPQTRLADTVWLESIPQAFSRILTAFEPALLIIIASFILWLLGRRLAYIQTNFTTTVTEFQFGTVILSLVFFTSYQLDLDLSGSVPMAMLFFSLALTGISVSHAQGNNSWLNSGQQIPWSGVLLLSIGAILLCGLIVSFIFTPDLIQIFIKFLKWIWGLIDAFFKFLASLFPPATPESSSPIPAIPGMEGNPEDTEGMHIPEWLTEGGRIVWIILFGGMMILAFWRITSQIFSWMRRRAQSGGGEVESLRSTWRQELVDWLKRIIGRIFRIKFKTANRNKGKNLPPEIASVRQLYSQLLNWTAAKGFPRQKSETPHEYRGTLDQYIPEKQASLDYITEEYMRARYGSLLPTENELSRLKDTWEQLKKSKIKHQDDTE